MFLQIAIERHGFLDHFLVQRGGIQQMESVLMPYSKSQMGNVETLFVTSDGNDVAIVYRIPEQSRITDSRLGNIAYLETGRF